MKEIEFWYEFASGYSHISAHRIERLTHQHNLSIIWRPFLLGPIFKSQGWDTSPFNIYETKGEYMWKDLERQCNKYNVPYSRPSEFPRMSLLAARVALVAVDQGWCPEFSKRVFMANYALDRDISYPDIIAEIITDIGRDAETILRLSQSAENKMKLRSRVQEAMNKGIFGAPSFIVNNELFWGNDRLEDAVEYCLSR